MKAKTWRRSDFYVFLFVLLVQLVKLNSFVSGHEDDKEKSNSEPREIPPSSRLVAFGRDGQLGGFYNYPDDKLSSSAHSFFRGEIPNWMRRETSSRFNWSRSVVIEKEGAKERKKAKNKARSYYDIFRNFETSEDDMMLQRLNFLFKSHKMTGRGEYLKELTSGKVYQKEAVVGAVTFAWGTVYEKVELDWNWSSVGEILQLPFRVEVDLDLDLDSLPLSSPRLPFSHVIMGAQYGAICTVRFLLKLEKESYFDLFHEEDEDKSWEEIQELEAEALLIKKKEIQGHLEKQMKFIRKSPEKARELFQKYFKQNPSAPRFQLDIYGDIPLPVEFQIQSKESNSNSRVKDVYSVLDFIEEVPKLLRKINGGKGFPISFDIVTIKSILQAAQSAEKMRRATSQQGEENLRNRNYFEPAPQPVAL